MICSYPYLPILSHTDTWRIIMIIPLFLWESILREMFCRNFISKSTLIRGNNPYITIFITHNLGYPVVHLNTQITFSIEKAKSLCRRFKDIDTLISTHPQVMLCILIEGRDIVITTFENLIIYAITLDRGAIIAIETIFGSKPHKAPRILEYAFHVVFR